MIKASSDFIPEEDYKKIVSLVPIACVDVFVVCGDEFLLGKRAIESAKGEWWPAGGRILKGELMETAAVREIGEEFGIDADPSGFEFLITEETIFDKSEEGVSRHTVNSVFKLELDEKPAIKLGSHEFSEVKWFSKIDPGWQPYVKHALRAAGFSE